MLAFFPRSSSFAKACCAGYLCKYGGCPDTCAFCNRKQQLYRHPLNGHAPRTVLSGLQPQLHCAFGKREDSYTDYLRTRRRQSVGAQHHVQTQAGGMIVTANVPQVSIPRPSEEGVSLYHVLRPLDREFGSHVLDQIETHD